MLQPLQKRVRAHLPGEMARSAGRFTPRNDGEASPIPRHGQGRTGWLTRRPGLSNGRTRGNENGGSKGDRNGRGDRLNQRSVSETGRGRPAAACPA